MKKVVIFGGTGFLGRSLAGHLRAKGYEPVLVARHHQEDFGFRLVQWDGRTLGDWPKELEGAEAIINLAGKSVNCVKTPDNCDLILRSRVEATSIIGKALATVQDRPKVWIQMSTAHIYGDPPAVMCTESSSTGYGLAPFVGKAWEQAFNESIPAEMRSVILRTSFVIGRDGGALPFLMSLVRWRLGGPVGNGRQGISWIHESDFNEIVSSAIGAPEFSGTYIVSAPLPVSNAMFMKTLRKEMRIFFGLPAPAWGIRLAARYFLSTDPELVLYGRYVRSERLERTGFTFKFPVLAEAIKDLV